MNGFNMLACYIVDFFQKLKKNVVPAGLNVDGLGHVGALQLLRRWIRRFKRRVGSRRTAVKVSAHLVAI